MSKVMLVNVTHVEESRVAVLEDGVLATYEIETINRTSLKGNIYNAIVDSVHASLEAAFVKIGTEQKGFLPLDEVNFRLLPSRTESRKNGRIGQHLHAGQKLMVQVVREPFAEKPPSVSTYFSLPGRYLVLMPGVESKGISRKIEDDAQRERLRKVVADLQTPPGFGVIVRTAGMGQTKTELQRDLRYLLRLWDSVQRSSKQAEFPALVYREADLVIRTMRDHFTPDIGEVLIDNKETYEKALEFVKNVMPTRARTLKLYTGERPLFNRFNLEEQIEKIYMRRVPLSSGGEIVIDGTEALTAIDVNSARSRRSGELEENALQTNLEAASEIARQLALRDLGGLIVVDFIDMTAEKNKKKVERTIREAMRADRAKYDVTRISKLGLMEIARQRMKGTKMAASYATCPTCDGHGLIKNVEAAALAALRKLQTRVSRRDIGRLRLGLPPDVGSWLLNHKREELSRLEHRHGVTVEIDPDPALLRHESSFTTAPPRAVRDREAEPAVAAVAPSSHAGSKKAAPAHDSRPKPGPAPVGEEPAGAKPREDEGEEKAKPAAAGAEGRARRKRRRRRRGGRSAAAVGVEGAEAKSRDERDSREIDTEAEAVPRGVRADELVPAATGSGGARSRRKGKQSGSRPRKRGSSRTPRRRASAASASRASDGSRARTGRGD